MRRPNPLDVQVLIGRTNLEFVLNDQDAELSAEKWQEVFGEQFPVLDEDLEGGQALAAATIALGPSAHAQPVTAIPVFGEDLRYRVRVDAWVYNLRGTKHFRGINSDVKVLSGHAVRFKATTNAPEPYTVRWQVVNTGAHATNAGDLRGTFFAGHRLGGAEGPKLETWETTKYTGRHWIECFIIQNGMCVARSGRFYLNVKNPQV